MASSPSGQQKKTKQFKLDLILLSKASWEFSKKEECNIISKSWQMYFQVSDYKGKNFLDLNDNKNLSI